MVSKGVDGVRDGKPPGARGGIQILGMVRGEWLRLAPQAYGGGSGLLGHCWHLASPGGSCSASLRPSSLAVIYSLFSLVQQWIHFTSVYSGLWEVQFLDKGVLAFRCATTGAGLSGHSCCAQRQFPMVQLFIFMVQFSDKVVVGPLLVNDRCPCSAVAVLHGR